VLGLHERLTLYCGRVAVPLRDSVLGGLELSAAKVSFPEDVPLWVGEKTTSRLTLSPALIVIGNDAPGIVNCELLLVAEETITVPLVAVIERLCLPVAPISTVPKLRALGEIVSWPILVPVPVTGIFTDGPTTKIPAPFKLASFGAKTTPSVRLWPGASVRGNGG
jgi:hypothetical protein